MTKAKQIAAALSVLLDGHPEGRDPRMRKWCEAMVESFLRDIEDEGTQKTEQLRIRSAPTKRELEKVIDSLTRARDAISKLPPRVRASFVDMDKQIRRAKLWAKVGPRPRHRISPKQRAAVECADFLLLITDQFVGATRGGKFHKLSAILYGDPKVDLFNHMRKYRSKFGPATHKT